MRYVIAHNNCAASVDEVCPDCNETKQSDSNAPLDIFQDGNLGTPVCESCQKEHAPDLHKALEAFYRQ